MSLISDIININRYCSFISHRISFHIVFHISYHCFSIDLLYNVGLKAYLLTCFILVYWMWMSRNALLEYQLDHSFGGTLNKDILIYQVDEGKEY